MKAVLALPITLLLALSIPALADNGKGNQGNGKGNGGNVRGAPGPLAGAGLPVLLIGGGIYWLVRRRKKTQLGS
jgi:LPXTG-motif cell wall-anchored protein